MMIICLIYGTVSIFYRHWLDLFDYTSEGFTTLYGNLITLIRYALLSLA